MLTLMSDDCAVMEAQNFKFFSSHFKYATNRHHYPPIFVSQFDRYCREKLDFISCGRNLGLDKILIFW